MIATQQLSLQKKGFLRSFSEDKPGFNVWILELNGMKIENGGGLKGESQKTQDK